MTRDNKKPDKNDCSESKKRTYVSDRCSRSADRETHQESPPNSPATIRVLDLPCRHQRRGAVRDKRTVSLDKPRPAHQREDNAYVETPFAAADGAVVPLKRGGFIPAAAKIADDRGALHQKCAAEASYSRGTASVAPADGDDTAPVVQQPVANGHVAVQQPAADADDAVVQPAAAAECQQQVMRLAAEPPPRLGDLDEFPAYVPWRAEHRVQRDPTACRVCHKCRCATCQKLCRYPGMRVCGAMDVSARCDEACVATAAAVCMPCVKKTARCPAANAARAEAAERRLRELQLELRRQRMAGDNREDGGGADPAESSKCLFRWLLCCPCPCCVLVAEAECSVGCRGNVNVSGCECVDWDALKRNNRHRVNAAASAVAAARDRRRCRDNLYYIKALPHLQAAAEAEAAAAEAAAKSAPAKKKSRLRRFLRF